MQPGSRIAHFEVLGLVGSGGMAAAYRTHHEPKTAWELGAVALSFLASTLTTEAA
jgi:hypothetical protein